MKISKKLLNEDTVGQVADAVNAESVINPDDTRGDIEKILDETLVQDLALKHSGQEDSFINVLFIGEAGTGKTGRIRAWAKENGINLVTKVASKLDATDVGGAVIASDPDENNKRYAIRLSSKEFELLERPYSVLFLDEFNRARSDVRAPLLKLVNEHVLDDPNEPDGLKHYPDFLFTIAAINPSDVDYDTDRLDAAEISRFRQEYVQGDKRVTLRYLEKSFDNIAQSAAETLKKIPNPQTVIEKREVEGAQKAIAATAGRKALAKAILEAPNADIHFDTTEEVRVSRGDPANQKLFQPRTLTQTLLACDGTKDDFLKKFPSFCNTNKLPDVQRVLKNYVDVVDKATDALKNHDTESPVFGSKKDRISKFSELINKQ